MLRARDLLSVTFPAALLAFAVQPLLDTRAPAQPAPVRAEGLVTVAPSSQTAHARPSVAAREAETAPRAQRAEETPAAPVLRPRPRVGCEGAISALAGQEARRLLPSRCLV
jgi:hypothetical protein